MHPGIDRHDAGHALRKAAAIFQRYQRPETVPQRRQALNTQMFSYRFEVRHQRVDIERFAPLLRLFERPAAPAPAHVEVHHVVMLQALAYQCAERVAVVAGAAVQVDHCGSALWPDHLEIQVSAVQVLVIGVSEQIALLNVGFVLVILNILVSVVAVRYGHVRIVGAGPAGQPEPERISDAQSVDAQI